MTGASSQSCCLPSVMAMSLWILYDFLLLICLLHTTHSNSISRKICPDYQYGRNCQLSCGHCHGDAVCNPVDGTCPGGCVSGFRGERCDKACDYYTYGLGCSSQCLNCRHHKPCNVVSGTCINGCQAGWMGDRCDTVCRNDTYGIDCMEACGHCRGKKPCDHVTGFCMERCEAGWTGRRCEKPCPTGHYGLECVHTCGHCKIGACEHSSGHCISGCATGWTGDTCKQECSPGWYGEACSSQCGKCTNMTCDKVTGLCTLGCQAGWQGLRCSRRCTNGFYDRDCKMTCGKCSGSGTCDPVSGVCPRGCRAGWQGPRCTLTTDSVSTDDVQTVDSNKKSPSAVPLLIVCIVVLFLALTTTVIYFVVIRPRRMDLATRLHRLTSARNQDAEGHIYEQIQTGPWEINKSNLILTPEKLGHGQFGQVRKAYIKKEHGHNMFVAVKSLKASEKDKTDFMNELAILKKVGYHPNVVCLVGSCHIAGTLYVAMEYCTNGDLRSYLRRSRKKKRNLYGNVQGFTPLPQTALLQFGLDVAAGMKHLADRQIIHRDLAARNILLNDSMVAKVADFGLSKHDETYIKTSHTRVPVRWLALESLFNNTYSTQSDVWSFGVLLWEIVTFGGTPYHGMDTQQFCNLLKQGYRHRRPKHCDAALYAMMLQCWLEDPQCRPTFEDLVLRLQRMVEDTQIYMNIEDETHYTELENK